MRTTYHFIVLLVSIWSIATTLPAAGDDAKITLGTTSPQPTPLANGGTVKVILIQLNFQNAAGSNCQILHSSPVLAPESYHLEKVKDGKEEAVAIRAILPLGQGDYYETLLLQPEMELDKSADYHLRVKGNWKLRTMDGKPINVAADAKGTLSHTVTAAEYEYAKLMAIENHVSLGWADGGTAVSFLAAFQKSWKLTNSTGYTHLEAGVHGDVGFDVEQRSVFPDNIEAELGYFYGDYLGRSTDGLGGWPFFIGINNVLESDRDFDNINETIGPWLKIYTPDLPPFCWLTRSAPFFGTNDNVASPAPLWEFGYSYVGKIKSEDVGPDYGDQRISGKLTWGLALFREIPFPLIGAIDGDLALQVGGYYHVEPSKFTDETKIELIIGKHTDEPDALKITVSYQEGKTTPKFEHYDAIIAGIRKAF